MANWLKISALIFFAVYSVQSFAQIVSFPVNSDQIDPSSDGFFYCLPRNTIKVDVQLKKTERFKGKYSDYATKMLGVTEFINKDATSYTLSQLTISTVSEVDSNQIYYAQLPAKLKDDKAFVINLTQGGYISSFSSLKDKEPKSKNLSLNDQKNPFRDLLKPVLIEKVDTIIRRVSIDTSIFEEKVLKRSISEKSNEQQAREIADLIYRIEDSKFSLITGYQEVNYSKESIQFMLDKLNAMEKEYIAFFKGSVIESVDNYSFFYTPNDKPEENLVTIFRFSSTDGITDKKSLSGDEITLSVSPTNSYEDARKFEEKRAIAKRKAKGIYYRVPEAVDVKVKLGNTILTTEQVYIYQMGFITFLPYNNLSNAAFDINGSLKTIIIE